MRKQGRWHWALTFAALALACAVPTLATEGDSEFEGEVVLAYRHVGVDGSEAKYNEDYDGLETGAFLGRLELRWTGLVGDIADYLSLDAEGLGGEPYERTAFRMGRQDAYDLKVAHSTQRTLYNLFELIGDEDGHTFNTETRRTRADLTFHLSPETDIFFGVSEVGRTGDSLFMKDLSRDVFLLETPVDKQSRQLQAGARFRLGESSIFVRQSFRQYDNRFENRTEGDLGLDQGDSTQLTHYDWRQREESDAAFTTLRARVPFGERFVFSFGYHGTLFGDEELENRVAVDAEGTAFNGDPLEIVDGFSRASIEQDSQLIDAELAIDVTEELALVLQYRSFEQESEGTLAQDLEGEGDTSELSPKLDYSLDTMSAILQYRPLRTLGVRVGFRSADRELMRSGFEIDARDHDFESDGDDTLLFGLAWTPHPVVDIDLDYEDGDVDTAFTNASFTERKNARARVTFKPKDGMRLRLTARDFERERPSPISAMRSEGQSLGVTFWHKPHERFEYRLGYTTRDVESITDALFDGAGFGGPAATIDGVSRFDAETDVISAHFVARPNPRWRITVDFISSESSGNNDALGSDINDPPAIPSFLPIDQDFVRWELGVEHELSGGLFAGASVGTFDYDDVRNTLDYDGEILTLRVGRRF